MVADEVRNLASRSATAARDTNSLIDGTVQRIQIGSDVTKDILQRFSVIAQATEKIENLIKNIKVSTGEQAQGMELINQAVAQISHVTKENAAASAESSAACQSLNSQVASIRRSVFDLSAVLGHGGSDVEEEELFVEEKPVSSPRKQLALPAPKQR